MTRIGPRGSSAPAGGSSSGRSSPRGSSPRGSSRGGSSEQPGRPTARDPYGILPTSGGLPAILSALGLVVVAVLTISLFTGQLPSFPSVAGGNGGDVAARTPAPSNVVVVDPRTSVPGSIVYAKAGNIWIQSGATATQITNTGNDSMPAWSPDGQWIYFIETRTDRGFFPAQGRPVYYDLSYPLLTRVRSDGTGRQTLLSGEYTTNNGRYKWFFWLRQPVVSPDGSTIALVSDAPDPTRSDVVLQLYNIASKKLTVVQVPENPPLGHQDPAWRPGSVRQILYVLNGHDGGRGTPSIWRYDLKTQRTSALTGPGYLSPAWSPDGRYVAATKTTSFGTDIVILDAKTGNELLRVTNDERSWAPVWSPIGDSIAFFHLEGGVVDLRLARLSGTGPNWTVKDVLDLTDYSGLDGASHPSWYIPPAEMPAPTATPAASPGGGAAAGSRASASAGQ